MAGVDRFKLVWTPFLKKRGEQILQAVGLVVPAAMGSGGQVSLRVGSREYRVRQGDLLAYPYHAGAGGPGAPTICLWPVPRQARATRCRAAWKMPSGRSREAQLVLKPADPVRVHVAFTARFGADGAGLERLLDHLDAASDRPVGTRPVWTLDPCDLAPWLDPRRARSRSAERLEHHISQGLIAWGLTPSAVHSDLLGLEEMCRSMYAARRLAERYGVPVPRAAWMTGAAAHTASLAMAVAAAGGRFLQINARPDSRPPAPPLFWWKLPDGERVLVHVQATRETPLLPLESWPWREWLVARPVGDDPHSTTLETMRHLDWIKRHFDWPVCRTGRLEAFGDAIARRHGHDLPVIEKEFTDWSACAVAGRPRASALVRRDKDRLASAEALGALAAWTSGTDSTMPPREEIRAGFRNLTLCAELADRDFAQAAHENVNRVGTASVTAFRGREKPAIGARGSDLSIMVANTLSWARGGVVRVSAGQLPPGEFELVDASTGGTVPYERDEGGIEFVAPRVPACGCLFLELRPCAHRNRPGRPADWDDRNLTLHTNETTLQFHTAGGLSRWHDRRHSVQWCSGTADYPTGAYLYEMPGSKRLGADEANLPQFGPLPAGKAIVRPEITPLYSRVVVEAPIPARRPPGRRSGDARHCRLTYTLYHNRPELYVNLRLFKKVPARGAEAGYAFFPFAIDKPYVLVDRIAHLVTPEDDLAAGVNAGYMAVHHGLRVEGDHAGMNFYPLDTPLVSFGAPGACLFDERGAYSKATIYATLFSNCAGMGPVPCESGDFSFDFVLHPTGNDGWDGGLSRGGMEYFRPLLAAVIPGRRDAASAGGGLLSAPAGSLLKIDPPAVQLVVLKPAGFERGYVLRLWNSLLDPADARLTLPAARRGDELWRCDLIERTTRRVAVNSEGQARLKLRPQEIVTLLLRV